MWRHKEDLFQEAREVALKCNVHYVWAGDYGLLIMVIGDIKCLTQTRFNYVAPTQPPNAHPPGIAGDTVVQIHT